MTYCPVSCNVGYHCDLVFGSCQPCDCERDMDVQDCADICDPTNNFQSTSTGITDTVTPVVSGELDDVSLIQYYIILMAIAAAIVVTLFSGTLCVAYKCLQRRNACKYATGNDVEKNMLMFRQESLDVGSGDKPSIYFTQQVSVHTSPPGKMAI